MAMQFNPYQTQAVNIPSNQSAIAQLTGQFGNQLAGLGQQAQNIGQDVRSQNVAKLIGSGALKGMTEEQARQAISQVSQGDVSEQTNVNMESLLTGKREDETRGMSKADLANLEQKNAIDLLTQRGIQNTKLERLRSENDMKLAKLNKKEPGRYLSLGSGKAIDTKTGKIIEGDSVGSDKGSSSSTKIPKGFFTEATKRGMSKNDREFLKKMDDAGGLNIIPHYALDKDGKKTSKIDSFTYAIGDQGFSTVAEMRTALKEFQNTKVQNKPKIDMNAVQAGNEALPERNVDFLTQTNLGRNASKANKLLTGGQKQRESIAVQNIRKAIAKSEGQQKKNLEKLLLNFK